MASSVAWLSFDVEQQRRTQLMMAALSNQGTVDELGLGPVRDLIAGTLHPGLSVLHTRAKYLLFLPRIYQGLSGSSADKLFSQGRSREGQLASRLAGYYRDTRDSIGARGIIGRNTLEHAKQPASVAYWPLLRSLDIRLGNGSVTEYCRELAESHETARYRSALHADDDVATHVVRWADLPPEPSDFQGFELTLDEAGWLRDRFRARESSTDMADRSLIDFLLDPSQHTWVAGVDRAWNHPQARQFPHTSRTAMELGRDLDQLIHGARILYNYLCADARPDHGDARDDQLHRYSTAMFEWRRETARALPSQDRLTDLDAWVSSPATMLHSPVGLARWRQTLAFVRSWQRLAEVGDDLLVSPAAAQLITNRENLMKPGRGRLTHVDRLRSWQGDSGYLRFDYNWGVATRLLSDIHAGLSTETVDQSRGGA